MRKNNILLLLLVGLLLIATACNAKTENAAVNVDAELVRGYADPIAEDILQAGNEKNYEKFSKDFTDVMKKSLDKAAFDMLITGFDDRIGEYESKELVKVETQKQYIITIYKAKYSKEPEGVSVRVVFEEKDGQNLVSGLFYDSPKLRKK